MRDGPRHSNVPICPWRAVVAAVTDEPGLTIVEQDDSVPYLRAEAQSTIPPDGTDDVEFVLRDDGGVRLLYRSATRQAVLRAVEQDGIEIAAACRESLTGGEGGNRY